MTVNHKDGNKDNNHISNLEWMTCADNIRHSFATGIRKKENMGKRKGKYYAGDVSVLEKAMDVRKKFGFSFRKLQKMFGVNRATLQYQFSRNYKLTN